MSGPSMGMWRPIGPGYVTNMRARRANSSCAHRHVLTPWGGLRSVTWLPDCVSGASHGERDGASCGCGLLLREVPSARCPRFHAYTAINGALRLHSADTFQAATTCLTEWTA